jgi:hypothetical protein
MSAFLNTWLTTCPTEPGDYLMSCMENMYEPEDVSVFRCNQGEILLATLDLFSNICVKYLHDGLTDVSWRKK